MVPVSKPPKMLLSAGAKFDLNARSARLGSARLRSTRSSVSSLTCRGRLSPTQCRTAPSLRTPPRPRTNRSTICLDLPQPEMGRARRGEGVQVARAPQSPRPSSPPHATPPHSLPTPRLPTPPQSRGAALRGAHHLTSAQLTSPHYPLHATFRCGSRAGQQSASWGGVGWGGEGGWAVGKAFQISTLTSPYSCWTRASYRPIKS